MPFGQPKRDTRGAYMRYFVGIDVSKEFHVVNVIDEEEKRVLKNFKFLNSKSGFDSFKLKLLTLSKDKDSFVLGLEATGVYGENLYDFLSSNGYNTKLLNPFQTSRYRQNYTMKSVKNDNIDSLYIALLLKDDRFSSGYVASDEYMALRVLYRNRNSCLKESKEIQKRVLSILTVTFPEFEKFINPFSVSGLALLKKYPTAAHYKGVSANSILKLFRHIKGNNFSYDKATKLLELANSSVYSGKAKEQRAIALNSLIRLYEKYQEEIATLDKEIDSLLNSDSLSSDDKTAIKEAKQRAESIIKNLYTIPGVSTKTISAILGECGDLSRFPTISKLLGFIGLHPTQDSSGKKEAFGHLSKRGNSTVKHALYLASVSSIRHNSELRKLYNDKRAAGKSKKEALIIVSRKLITIIYAIFKNNEPYNPSRVFAMVRQW